jgi:hypothetical protein
MDFEKLKKKRGRKSKKELEFIRKYEIENNVKLNNKDDKKPKKRGRKPKGGKIMKQQEIDSTSNPENLHNVILHLKCSEFEVMKSNNFLSDMKYNPVIGNIQPYNTNNLNQTLDGDIKGLQYYNIEVSVDENDTICNYKDENNDNHKDKSECYVQEKDDCHTKSDKKAIWEKLKTLQTKLHNNNINNKQSSCFWCTCAFDNPSVSIPIHELDGNYKGYGCFCMPECAVGYLFDENIDSSQKWERYGLINTIYKDIYNYKDNINPSPKPHYLLEKFYGNLNIEEFRSLNRNNSNGLLMVVNKPMTRVLPELFHDANDQIIDSRDNKDNKTKYKLSRKNPPINKTVVNEKTWLF